MCVCCVPLTAAVLLLPVEAEKAQICCFHEACVSFAGVATAATVLAITLDRYDISVRPASRVLTTGRAVALLASIWALSFLSFLLPFLEVGFFSGWASDAGNQTAVPTASERNRYSTELGLYYHLLAQIPIFLFTAVVMLITYSKILQALNIRIGTRFQHGLPRKRPQSKAPAASTDAAQSGAGARPGASAALGMRASVSVIIALRRAVRRHREKRERQKRVFRMSLLIVSTFLLCWAPITVLNAAILSTGPTHFTLRLRLGFLAMAYGTTISHPLLYAFTRQKLQRALKSHMKKRAVSGLQAEAPPTTAVRHNCWTHPRSTKKVTFEDSGARQSCLQDAE